MVVALLWPNAKTASVFLEGITQMNLTGLACGLHPVLALLSYESFGQPALRLLLAMVLGGLIGWERERHGRHAGLRTHLLLCVGCTLIMLVSQHIAITFASFDGTQVRVDPGRIAAHVVSGIGFLGAGTIIVLGKNVMGLTTAACLWVTAAMGLAIGAGCVALAIVTFVIVIFALLALKRLERLRLKHDRYVKLELRFSQPVTVMDQLKSLLMGHALTLLDWKMTRAPDNVAYELSIRYVGDIDLEAITQQLMERFRTAGLEQLAWR